MRFPEETPLGKKITKQTKELIKKEKLRKEVEDFYKRNEPEDTSPTSCPACIEINGAMYRCQMDRSHRGALGGLFENRVVGTNHLTFVPNPDPEDSRPVALAFSDESVGKLLEAQKSEQAFPAQEVTDGSSSDGDISGESADNVLPLKD